jgi:hypothetical protein
MSKMISNAVALASRAKLTPGISSASRRRGAAVPSSRAAKVICASRTLRARSMIELRPNESRIATAAKPT